MKHRSRKPDITETHSQVAAEWDHERNEIEPTDVTYGSERRVWWRCSVQDCGHRWQAIVGSRTSGSGCPKCRWRPGPGQSLADKHPEIAVQWDDERNPMTPQDVGPWSEKEVWWRCPVAGCGLRWQTTVGNRTIGSGCPRCRRKPASGQSLADKRPEIAAQWDDERNPMTPGDVMPGTSKKVWWRCSDQGCGHRWQTTVGNRTRGSGCPKCRWRPGPGQSLADKRPEIAAQWDDERNPMTPQDVGPWSQKKVWWRCSDRGCGYGWRSVVSNRTRGRGCPACAGRATTATNNLAARRPDVAAQWDHEANGELKPEDVTPGSEKRAWWRCPVSDCGHRWQALVVSRTRGTGCPECARRRIPVSGQSLADKHPEIAAQWDDERNPMTPQDVTPGSGKRAWWRCPVSDCGHRWQAVVGRRTRGSGCPMCVYRRRLARKGTDGSPTARRQPRRDAERGKVRT